VISQTLVSFGIVLALIALAIRFAGNNAVLAGSKDAGVKDMAKLNKWVGNRFLLLPIIAFGFAPFSVNNTAVGIVGCMLLFFAVFGVIIWISVGSKQFVEKDHES
jgi:hypothetical protein